jgi:hypothetical protein
MPRWHTGCHTDLARARDFNQTTLSWYCPEAQRHKTFGALLFLG